MFDLRIDFLKLKQNAPSEHGNTKKYFNMYFKVAYFAKQPHRRSLTIHERSDVRDKGRAKWDLDSLCFLLVLVFPYNFVFMLPSHNRAYFA